MLPGCGTRLFRHDRRLLVNAARLTFAGWGDRLIAALMLTVALAAARSALGDRPWTTTALAAAAGVAVSRLLTGRLVYHGSDGILAADAARRPMRLLYRAAWHAVAFALLAAVTLIIRPALIVTTMPAYCAAATAADVTAHFVLPRLTHGRTAANDLRRWLNRPPAAIVASTIFVAALWPVATLEVSGRLIAVGAATLLLAAVLGSVDHAAIRFAASSGHRPSRIVLRHARGLLLFASITGPACWLSLGSTATGVNVAVSLTMLWLLTARVLAYAGAGKRAASLLLSIATALLALVAYSAIPLLPFVALAVLWQLQRRAAMKTWLLA